MNFNSNEASLSGLEHQILHWNNYKETSIPQKEQPKIRLLLWILEMNLKNNWSEDAIISW